MADIVDLGNDRAEEILRDSIARVSMMARAPHFTGECAYCGAGLSHPKRFCDSDCRDDWDREQRIKALK